MKKPTPIFRGRRRSPVSVRSFADLCLTSWRRRPWKQNGGSTEDPPRALTGREVHLRAWRRFGGQPSRGLPTVAHARVGKRERRLERETGFEPATSTLARSHSTTELFPLEPPTYHTVGMVSTGSRRIAALKGPRYESAHARLKRG